MALQMRRPMPLAASEACFLVEIDTRPSLSELDCMPQELINTVMLYKSVKSAIETGSEMDL